MREYHIFNLFVVLIALGVVLIVIFEPFTIQCMYSQIGSSCKTCGLTRAFRSVLNGDLKSIRGVFLPLFVLLPGQLLLRPCISVMLATTRKIQIIRNIDIFVTVILLVAFYC